MSVVYPTVNQAAFINGFLMAPIVPERFCQIEATPGASEFVVSFAGPEPKEARPCRAVVRVVGRQAPSTAIFEIRSDESQFSMDGSRFSSLSANQRFAGCDDLHRLRDFRIDDPWDRLLRGWGFGFGAFAMTYESRYGDAVRALALAVFPEFELPLFDDFPHELNQEWSERLEKVSVFHQRGGGREEGTLFRKLLRARKEVVGAEEVERLRQTYQSMVDSGMEPLEALREGAKYAESLAYCLDNF